MGVSLLASWIWLWIAGSGFWILDFLLWLSGSGFSFVFDHLTKGQ
jgi:hypothetical protein